VIDVARPCLDAAGIPEPTFVHGVQQLPYEGVSMRYARRQSRSGQHETQYFEMFCNRGIYHQGWTAVTKHSTPWDPNAPLVPLTEDRWELYADTDWTQAHDLSAEMPEKLAHLQQLGSSK
jgi:arylsulfatase